MKKIIATAVLTVAGTVAGFAFASTNAQSAGSLIHEGDSCQTTYGRGGIITAVVDNDFGYCAWDTSAALGKWKRVKGYRAIDEGGKPRACNWAYRGGTPLPGFAVITNPDGNAYYASNVVAQCAPNAFWSYYSQTTRPDPNRATLRDECLSRQGMWKIVDGHYACLYN